MQHRFLCYGTVSPGLIVSCSSTIAILPGLCFGGMTPERTSPNDTSSVRPGRGDGEADTVVQTRQGQGQQIMAAAASESDLHHHRAASGSEDISTRLAQAR